MRGTRLLEPILRPPFRGFYPGERSAAVAAERAEKGVPVTPKVWRELTESAERFGIAPPTPIV
ncbi:hypothetical protein [Streptomyces phaeochromogenes]|uniref:hypothetical protein n=1 Tax=Streptomyces phaeochromogenes TaxID=1923 RepID=UPI002DD9568E|nr:hypothetical protein [Streptomyces phaeochromogenes]WRZ27590.1 Ldh family oxidoreductase [Streptomyces phaeochromogenes]